MEDVAFDPKRRKLCPDGACVGLLGPDGRCKVCGLPEGAPGVEPISVPADSEVLGEERAAPAAAKEAVSSTGGFNPKRQLCEDGSCVGVVGADRRCSVCGRAQ